MGMEISPDHITLGLHNNLRAGDAQELRGIKIIKSVNSKNILNVLVVV